MQDAYLTFEFYKITEMVKDLTKTELGGVFANEMKTFSDPIDVKKALDDLNEVSSLYTRYGPLPIGSSLNVFRLIDLAKKSGMLTPRDLYFIAEDVKTISLIAKYLDKYGSGYPLVMERRNRFADLTNLEGEIRRIITTSFTVSDHASSELRNIRLKLKKAEESLLNKVSTISLSYSSYLNDGNATIREGHFVLPVKTSYKNKIMGVIYDVSDSGNTTFIEPLEVVQLNNEITSLKLAENEEVRRILKQVTNLVLIQENEVLNNNKIIGELDFIQAKALYGINHNAIIADSNDKQIIDLCQARHPLIDEKKVVANDYHLDEEKRIVIISGPNAGGKTVSLKTVGLLTMMHLSGLPVTAHKATFGFFKNIYIDIGDNQSLADNLSTFSAHISQIAEITNVVKGKDLVLLDELGTGTDPKEGEAIALSTVSYLLTKHCLAMISSHFGKLKEYAFTNPSIENSSMLFDENKLLPTYIFKLGVPGKSYALEVANRYALNKNIINDAKAIINGDKNNEASNLLDILQKKVEENAFLEAENKKQEEILKKDKIALEKAQNELKRQHDTLLASVKEEKARIINETQEKIDEIMKMMANSDLKLHEVIEIKNKLTALEEEEEQVIFDEEIKVNDHVTLPALNISGVVMRINGKKAHLISDDGLAFDVEINKLHKEDVIETPKVKKNHTVKYEEKINTDVGLELNIIGLRRDEALEKVTKYLDNCRVKHLKQVRIIHGFGSGILRNMVQDYLKKQTDLKYRLGDAYEGGGGATIVIFND